MKEERLFGIDAISKQCEIASQRVIGENSQQLVCQPAGNHHAHRLTFDEPQPKTLIEHMGVEGYYQRLFVDEIGPNSQIHWRRIAHHPPKKHTHTLATRLCILWHNSFNLPIGKIATKALNGINGVDFRHLLSIFGRQTVFHGILSMNKSLYIISQAPVLQ